MGTRPIRECAAESKEEMPYSNNTNQGKREHATIPHLISHLIYYLSTAHDALIFIINAACSIVSIHS